MKLSKMNIKDAERRLRLLLYSWEDNPNLTIKELVLSLAKDKYSNVNVNMKGEFKEVVI